MNTAVTHCLTNGPTLYTFAVNEQIVIVTHTSSVGPWNRYFPQHLSLIQARQQWARLVKAGFRRW